MFIVDELREPEVWALGDFAGENRGKPAAARADVEHEAIADLKVEFARTPHEHPRHVNVGGWPAEKDEQKALAVEFCARSTLSVRPG